MKGKEFLEKTMSLADSYHEQLRQWYEKEKDISLVPDPVVEGFLGLTGSLYLTFSYEMESLDKWYNKEFDRIKFSEDKPLSDKATDAKVKITETGERIVTLERRLKALKMMKETLSRAIQARIEAKKDSYR